MEVLKMAFCRNCGGEVSSDAYVCIKCGSLMSESKKGYKTNDSKLEFCSTTSFWLLFVAVIFIGISVLFFNIDYTFAEGLLLRDGRTVLILTTEVNSMFALIAACISFVLILISYLTSFNAVKKKNISRTTNYFLLLFTIISFIYAFAKYVVYTQFNPF